MRRFFCLSSNVSGKQIIVNDMAELHHIKNVSRLKLNDVLSVFDDKGKEYQCCIDSFTNDCVKLRIINQVKKNKNSRIYLTVACAIAKGSRFNTVLEKLTELGVKRVIPVKTKRTIPNVGFKLKKKNSRWMKIIISACKQSFREDIPKLSDVMRLEDVFNLGDDFALKLIAFKHKDSVALLRALKGRDASNVLMLIGPEGDFTEEEVLRAKKHGFISVSLGDNVLRVDTASIYASSVIISHANS